MAHGLTLERRLTLISCAAAGQRKTRNHPGTPPRPILIGYEAENPCTRSTGSERVIETHNIQSSEAGNIVIDAWCRMCGHVERFRLDRITHHRALRQKFKGPVPPVTPYFTDLGPVGIDQLIRPISTKTTTTGLLARARARITDAARFRAVFGPAESYPRRALHDSTASGLLSDARARITDAARFRAVFGPAESYPRRRARPLTSDDLLREMRRSIRVAAGFNYLVADLDLTTPAEVSA